MDPALSDCLKQGGAKLLSKTKNLVVDTSVHFTSDGEPVFGRSKLSSLERWLVQVRTDGGEIVEVCTNEKPWNEMTSGAEFTAADGDRKH